MRPAWLRSRRGRYDADDGDDDDEFEAGEVFETVITVSDWRRPDGAASTLTELPVEETEFSPPDAFEDMEPDEEHFHEATGNAGASFERTYSRAALVLWPSDGFLAVLSQGGLQNTLPRLAELTRRWEQEGAASRVEARRDAPEFIAEILSRWPKPPIYAEDRDKTGHAAAAPGRCRRPGGEPLSSVKERMFFFEKKNQKTFALALISAWVPAGLCAG